MKVIDDVIPVVYQDAIERLFFSDTFAWFYCDTTVLDYPSDIASNVEDSWQLCHVLATKNGANSEHFGFVLPILYALAETSGLVIDQILRIKVNLVFSNGSKGVHKPPHTDIAQEGKYYTAIYYVNDSDGDTLFFSGKEPVDKVFKPVAKVSPKKGSAVLFDGHTYHAGQLPTNYKHRCIINFNFTVKE